jgi:RNA polymerase sigma-70 factor, ECF subfamily
VEFSLTLSESQSREQPTDFAAVFAAYRGRICRYLYSLVGEATQAEDLAQDCFLKAYRALQSGQPPDNLSAWLYTIATNVAISHLRRRRLIAWLPLLPAGEAETVRPGGDPAVVASERDLLRQTLAKLSPADASCLLLRFQADLSYTELASVLGTSEGAAKTRVCRARAIFCETYARLSREASR